MITGYIFMIACVVMPVFFALFLCWILSVIYKERFQTVWEDMFVGSYITLLVIELSVLLFVRGW